MQLLLHVSLSAEPPVERIALTGSHASFGRWNPRAGIALEQCGNFWVTKDPIRLSPCERVEFKFVRIRTSGEVEWESGANRILQVPPDGSDVHFQGSFNGDGVVRFKHIATSESMLWKQRHDEAVQALQTQRKDFECRRQAHEMNRRYRSDLIMKLKQELAETQRQLKASQTSALAPILRETTQQLPVGVSSGTSCSSSSQAQSSVLVPTCSETAQQTQIGVTSGTACSSSSQVPRLSFPTSSSACADEQASLREGPKDTSAVEATSTSIGHATNGKDDRLAKSIQASRSFGDSRGGPQMGDLAPSRFVGSAGDRNGRQSPRSVFNSGTRSPVYEKGVRSPGIRSPVSELDSRRGQGSTLDDKPSKESKRSGLLTVGVGDSAVGLLASKEVMKAFKSAKDQRAELDDATKAKDALASRSAYPPECRRVSDLQIVTNALDTHPCQTKLSN